MKILKAMLFTVLASVVALGSGCTRIDDGYVGVTKGKFSGEISDKPLGQGIHQTLTQEITEVSIRNIVVPVVANPNIKENIPMGNMEVKINYGVNPNLAPHIYKTESARNLVTENGDVFLLAIYVREIAEASINDVVRSYKAMEVNQNRVQIEKDIKTAITQKLKDVKKENYININEVNILKVLPPQSVVESAVNIIRTQNELIAKTNEVETARKEQEKMEILSKQADKQYIELINAQSNATMAEATKIGAMKGNLVTVLVPHGFNGNMTVSK